MFKADAQINGYLYRATVYAITYSPISSGMIAICRTPWSDEWHRVPLDDITPIEEE